MIDSLKALALLLQLLDNLFFLVDRVRHLEILRWVVFLVIACQLFEILDHSREVVRAVLGLGEDLRCLLRVGEDVIGQLLVYLQSLKSVLLHQVVKQTTCALRLPAVVVFGDAEVEDLQSVELLSWALVYHTSGDVGHFVHHRLRLSCLLIGHNIRVSTLTGKEGLLLAFFKGLDDLVLDSVQRVVHALRLAVVRCELLLLDLGHVHASFVNPHQVPQHVLRIAHINLAIARRHIGCQLQVLDRILANLYRIVILDEITPIAFEFLLRELLSRLLLVLGRECSGELAWERRRIADHFTHEMLRVAHVEDFRGRVKLWEAVGLLVAIRDSLVRS